MNRLSLALLLTVATAVVASNGEPEVPAIPVVAEPDDSELAKNGLPTENGPESRQDLSVGTISGRLMARTSHRTAGSSFITHDEDITIRGVEYNNITAIRVTRVGNSANGRPTIKAGGLGFNYVTIGFLGNRNLGYEYNIEVYTSIGC